MRRVLGYAMMASPFVGLAIFLATLMPIWQVLAIFGGSIAVTAWFVAGARMSA